jgi:hypothetical protein
MKRKIVVAIGFFCLTSLVLALTLTDMPNVGQWGNAKQIVNDNNALIETAVDDLETDVDSLQLITASASTVTNDGTIALTASGIYIIEPINGAADSTNSVTLTVASGVKASLIVKPASTNLLGVAGLVMNTNDCATVYSSDGTNIFVLSSQIAE